MPSIALGVRPKKVGPEWNLNLLFVRTIFANESLGDIDRGCCMLEAHFKMN